MVEVPYVPDDLKRYYYEYLRDCEIWNEGEKRGRRSTEITEISIKESDKEKFASIARLSILDVFEIMKSNKPNIPGLVLSPEPNWDSKEKTAKKVIQQRRQKQREAELAAESYTVSNDGKATPISL